MKEGGEPCTPAEKVGKPPRLSEGTWCYALGSSIIGRSQDGPQRRRRAGSSKKLRYNRAGGLSKGERSVGGGGGLRKFANGGSVPFREERGCEREFAQKGQGKLGRGRKLLREGGKVASCKDK